MNQAGIPSLIIDDEASSRENISYLLQRFCPGVRVMGTAANERQAKELIGEIRPSLVFLDIQLGEVTAFSLLKQLESIDFEIIFVTAHDHFALRAFEFMAVDYLLKPVEIPLLVKAVDNAAKRIAGKSLNLSIDQVIMQVEDFNRDRHKLALTTAKGYELVYIRDILYCLADGSYTQFYFRRGEVLVVSKNLKYYENLLAGYGFIRSHNTALVNMQYIKTIERTGGGALVMEDGKTLPVSKARRQELEAKIRDDRRLI